MPGRHLAPPHREAALTAQRAHQERAGAAPLDPRVVARDPGLVEGEVAVGAAPEQEVAVEPRARQLLVALEHDHLGALLGGRSARGRGGAALALAVDEPPAPDLEHVAVGEQGARGGGDPVHPHSLGAPGEAEQRRAREADREQRQLARAEQPAGLQVAARAAPEVQRAAPQGDRALVLEQQVAGPLGAARAEGAGREHARRLAQGEEAAEVADRGLVGPLEGERDREHQAADRDPVAVVEPARPLEPLAREVGPVGAAAVAQHVVAVAPLDHGVQPRHVGRLEDQLVARVAADPDVRGVREPAVGDHVVLAVGGEVDHGGPGRNGRAALRSERPAPRTKWVRGVPARRARAAPRGESAPPASFFPRARAGPGRARAARDLTPAASVRKPPASNECAGYAHGTPPVTWGSGGATLPAGRRAPWAR